MRKKKAALWMSVTAVLGGLSSTPLPAADSASSVTKSQICKAGVATVMGRDPKIMRIDREAHGVVYLSYVRGDDGSLWSYKCKIDGSLIIWGSDTGRWRDNPADPTVTYRIKPETIQVEEKYGDGSTNKQSFNLNQIGN